MIQNFGSNEETFFSPIFNPEEEPNFGNIDYSCNSFFSEINPLVLNNRQFHSLHSNPVEYTQEFQNEIIDKDESELNQEMANEGELDFNNENPFESLNIPSLPILDDQERIEREIEKEKQNNISENNFKKTNDTSKEEKKDNNPVLIPFQTKKPQKRIDYCIKYFKTNFVEFLKKYGNMLIKRSFLPKELKKEKLSAPNHLSFTGNAAEKDNYKFLFFKVEDIFCFYKNENCKISLQKKNRRIIDKILQFIDGSESEEKYSNVKAFFKMSLEDAYEIFYESEDFKKYATYSKTVFLDKEFKVEKGYSLLEKNAFVKMIKMYGKRQ